jgi:hypothetical protein
MYHACIHPYTFVAIKTEVPLIRGINKSAYFDPDKLREHREAIKAMVAELPDSFSQGWTFHNACVDKHGNHWGEHPNVEELMMLGLATCFITYMFEREIWSILPGCMPYIVTHLDLQ